MDDNYKQWCSARLTVKRTKKSTKLLGYVQYHNSSRSITVIVFLYKNDKKMKKMYKKDKDN